MAEKTPHPIVQQALDKLRALGHGNGIGEDDIKLVSADAATHTIMGVMRFEPIFTISNKTYAGTARGKKLETFKSVTGLQQALQKRQQEHHANPSLWFGKVMDEVKGQQGQGWGLDGAEVTLAEETKPLVATENCPSCQGQGNNPCNACYAQGSVTCPTCQGRGKELCFQCSGSGRGPTGEPCFECRGTNFADCRQCVKLGQQAGRAICPQCRGARTITCTPCKGMGKFTEEVVIKRGAKASFAIQASGLPSGLNRALDRLGIPNLAKGHAVIETFIPGEDDDAYRDNALIPKDNSPFLMYSAALPYAEIKLAIKNKPLSFSAFGDKCVLLNVPPFLDDALGDACSALQQAAQGQPTLERAAEMRAIRDALSLTLRSTYDAKALRRIYPAGLSNDKAAEIMQLSHTAIKRLTEKTRGSTALILALIITGLLFTYTQMGPHIALRQTMTVYERMTVDALMLLPALFLAITVFSAITRFALLRHFPGQKLPLFRRIGKVGVGMCVAITLIYLGFLLVSFFR